jgi:hypothetical protein
MSSREFTEWMELDKQEPFGDEWEMTGTIVASNTNLWSKRKFKPGQFIPRETFAQRRDPQELEAQMQQFAKMHNARITQQEQARKDCEATLPARAGKVSEKPQRGRKPKRG